MADDEESSNKRPTKRVKPTTTTVVAKDILADLPLESLEEDFENPYFIQVTLKEGWWIDGKESLIDYAVEQCDPGGQVSHHEFVDYDQDRARMLLTRYGHADVEHFLIGKDYEDNDPNRLADDESGGYDEVGWNVQVKTKHNVSLKRAWQLANDILGGLLEAENSDGSTLPPTAVAIKNRLSALLSPRNIHESSIWYAKCDSEYRHTDYPSGGHQCSLMWLTVDNRQVELVGSNDYRTV